MEKIGLFYGSDTGCTEAVVEKIKTHFEDNLLKCHEINGIKSTKEFEKYNHIIIDVPTWYDGDLKSDWDSFFETFKTIDFTGKTVAIFGLGDQVGYGEYFVDGIGTLGNVVLENGGHLIGAWTTEGYNYDESSATFEYEDNQYFMGLALDEDNQKELTDERLTKWLQDITAEFNIEPNYV